MKSEEYLEKLHLVLVEILDYVVDVCEKNNLTYFIAYGTTLGAYRHSGFIPWDDDIDIAMPRKDYEKLLELLDNSECEKYSIQNEMNEPNYFLQFAKVRKNGTVFIEEYADNIYKNTGIYIDVFPLDYLDNKDSLVFKMKYKFIKYLKHILKFKSCRNLFKSNESKFKYIIDLIISIPAYLLSNKKMLKFIKKLSTSNGLENSKYFVQFDSSTRGAILERSIYLPSKKINFVNKSYFAPGNTEEYLKMHYGEDFMELPPIEKRHTHVPIEIKFE